MPAICSENPGKIQLLKWGLIPSWVRSKESAEDIRLKTFNARAESLDNKPSFSKSFKSKRCIVPVKGFYEWQHTTARKIPWYIYRADDGIMSLAGLWDEWVETSTGEIFRTFTIVTTTANDMMAVIHNSKKRMPVILDKNEENRWLDLTIKSSEALEMTKPCPSEILKAHTISLLINNRIADRNSPDIIKHYSWSSEDSLF